MRVGIIGLARSGKTTIFNSLTGSHAEVGTFGSREANVAVIKVPDERVDRLAEIYKPRKKPTRKSSLWTWPRPKARIPTKPLIQPPLTS